MSAARMRGDRAHLGCAHTFVYSSPSVWIARKKKEYSESMIARFGGSIVKEETDRVLS